jgi:hypothetical protein
MNKQVVQKRIETLEAELERLKEEVNKPEKFEMEFTIGGTYILYPSAAQRLILPKCAGDSTSARENGAYRTTEQGAKLSLERNKKANRLEMLVEYLGGLVDGETSENRFYVYRSVYGTWVYSGSGSCFYPGVVYTTREVAIRVCELLNSGEYEI